MEMNLEQLAELTGKTYRTIKKRIGQLNPVREDGKSKFYDTKEALKLIYPTVGEELQKETLLLERARRKKLELEVAKMSGELIPISVIVKAIERDYSIVRRQYLSLSSKMAKQLAIITDASEVESRLTEAINDILNELKADAVFRSKKRDMEAIRSDMVLPREEPNTHAETQPS